MKRKQDLGRWLVDISKYAAASTFFSIAFKGFFFSITTYCLLVITLVLFFSGLTILEGKKQKKFDSNINRNPSKPKRSANEAHKQDRNRGKKRPSAVEHTPNEIKVD